MTVEVVWVTPDAEKHLAYIARVSNPDNQENPNYAKLLKYMLDNGHWSPFEMVNLCIEINTTRDIARQILRHRSFSYQEFCVAEGTLITTQIESGETRKVPIENLYAYQSDPRMDAIWKRGIRVYDESTKTFVRSTIKEVFDTGKKECYKVTLEDGKEITCTEDHKFFTRDGFSRLADIKVGDFVAVNGQDVYKSIDWMKQTKEESLSAGRGVQYIADKAGVSYHTIRKWLKAHGLQFSKKENAIVAGGIWNKGLPKEEQPMFGKTHQKQTREKMIESSRKGDKSNLWMGGKERSLRYRAWSFNNKWKNHLIVVNGEACAICGTVGESVYEVDHKLPVWSHPDLAFDVANLQLLCKPCHRKKSTREAIESKLTIRWKAVKSIEYVGVKQTYDLEVNHDSHNYIANGIVTHNSQRYQTVDKLGDMVYRECRLQDTKNRQNSLPCEDEKLAAGWEAVQYLAFQRAKGEYEGAVAAGIAKEVARALLPEGLTPSRMYVNGTLRSWIHYVEVRCDESTQKEHREIANAVKSKLVELFPTVASAMGWVHV